MKYIEITIMLIITAIAIYFVGNIIWNVIGAIEDAFEIDDDEDNY